MKDLGITKGEATVKNGCVQVFALELIKTETICRVYGVGKEHIVNANLIVDSFNTSNKCGMLPSDLLERYNEAVEALEVFTDNVDKWLDTEIAATSSQSELIYNQAKKVINKHKEG